MKYRKITSAIGIGMLSLAFISPLLWAGEPGKLLMETIDKGFAILKDPSLKGEEKTLERRQMLWKGISPIFNFDEMSKRALGQHWKSRTPEEKRNLWNCLPL